MACRYYDAKSGTCKKSTGFVAVGADRVKQYCKGNWKRCPDFDSNQVSFSWDESAKNRQAKNRGDNIRSVAPIVLVIAFLVCYFVFHLSLGLSIGGAVFFALIALMFTNKYH